MLWTDATLLHAYMNFFMNLNFILQELICADLNFWSFALPKRSNRQLNARSVDVCSCASPQRGSAPELVHSSKTTTQPPNPSDKPWTHTVNTAAWPGAPGSVAGVSDSGFTLWLNTDDDDKDSDSAYCFTHAHCHFLSRDSVWWRHVAETCIESTFKRSTPQRRISTNIRLLLILLTYLLNYLLTYCSKRATLPSHVQHSLLHCPRCLLGRKIKTRNSWKRQQIWWRIT